MCARVAKIEKVHALRSRGTQTLRKERERAENAALLEAEPCGSAEEFNAVAAKTTRTPEETARMRRTWLENTWGHDVKVTEKNVKRLAGKGHQRVFRAVCQLRHELQARKAKREAAPDAAAEVEAQQADARAVLERMKRASMRETNESFVTETKHRSAQLDCILSKVE